MNNAFPFRELKYTADGSATMYVPQWDEHYHSIHGAIQESEHVFINAGLKYFYEKYGMSEIQIYEVGFGTGLNALLSAKFATDNQIKVNYHAIEAYPLSLEEAISLNYTQNLDTQWKNIFEDLHRASWEEKVEISNYFSIYKEHGRIEDKKEVKSIDIVYFDAFAPSAQPELWTELIFKSFYDYMSPDGILVTYCAKGIVKRAMKSAGWSIEKLQGPPGKREMTRAFVFK
ncbi:MAG: tRNA (5-methylaminomethyl-2-thiouridine)(34)-methyltransferase MnmD [Chitinophagales bacterium]|nr:tRNA (5-methylaminomethyl-2-thiouridine)(34)-methyltransferase MnmD [Chitinophagales bacterium]MCZ2394883.1 tRNA (5-methylaminomethyl-2-thiouridine)(34)-methyltransferase MnmD [Chitinophagales bacterium]